MNLNKIHESSIVTSSKLGKDVFIDAFSSLKECIIGDGVKIHKYCNLYSCEVKKGTQLGSHITIQNNVVIGKNCKIGDFVFIAEGSRIGDNVMLCMGSKLCNDKHPAATNKDGSLKTRKDWKLEPVKIKGGATLGCGAIILPGVVVGKNALCGAGSVVTKDVGDKEVVVGNPAKKLRKK